MQRNCCVTLTASERCATIHFGALMLTDATADDGADRLGADRATCGRRTARW
jgi:hypothetical protein